MGLKADWPIRFHSGNAAVLIFGDVDRAAQYVSGELCTLVRHKLDAVLGLPTGRTFEPVYRYISEDGGRPSFGGVRSFNVDEYCGLSSDSRFSYRSFMEQHLFKNIDIRPENVHFPETDSKNPERYDEDIALCGGLDLLLLGLGMNGHIGFNEPGTNRRTLTHKVRLSESTIKANSALFAGSSVPEYAITMGIGTMLSARHILLAAFGRGKEEIVEKLLRTGQEEGLPATLLKGHKDTTFVFDRDACPEKLASSIA